VTLLNNYLKLDRVYDRIFLFIVWNVVDLTYLFFNGPKADLNQII